MRCHVLDDKSLVNNDKSSTITTKGCNFGFGKADVIYCISKDPEDPMNYYLYKDKCFVIVPFEAMAPHKPIIACNGGSPIETVKHRFRGFLCDPAPEEFARAMADLIQDTEMVERMGKQA